MLKLLSGTDIALIEAQTYCGLFLGRIEKVFDQRGRALSIIVIVVVLSILSSVSIFSIPLTGAIAICMSFVLVFGLILDLIGSFKFETVCSEVAPNGST